MAFSLSRTISSKLVKPCPLSSLSLNHSIRQILNSTCSSPTSHDQNPQNPSSNPSFIFYADNPTPTLNRFPSPFGSEPTNPSFKSLTRLDPCLNPFKTHSGIRQTACDGKRRCHFPSLMSSYSGYAVSLRSPTIPSLPFFRSFASSANSSSEVKASDPEPKPITPSSAISNGSSDSVESESHSQHPQFQHQEIVGPTVERDVSPLAEETRQVLQNLKKTIYNLSRMVALLGLVQLSCGAWIAYAAEASPLSVVSIQSFMAFSFPFSLAFLLRQMLKPMSFFQKMEEQGRLQILTLSLQVSKCLNLFFLRLRVASFFCVVGMSMGLLYSTWSGLN
ncbi:hypothetical protein ACLOJK_015041 [Asimina triloba]